MSLPRLFCALVIVGFAGGCSWPPGLQAPPVAPNPSQAVEDETGNVPQARVPSATAPRVPSVTAPSLPRTGGVLSR